METQSEIEITKEDVLGLMDQFTRVPPLLLKIVISKNFNVVKSFQGQIEDYKNKLSQEEILKIKKVLDMPVFELQKILLRTYAETHQKQLKILADPKSQPFIEKNLKYVGEILF